MSSAIEITDASKHDVSAITSIFKDTIRHINSKDYTEAQIEVWASSADDTEKWLQRINDLYFIVASLDKTIVGFSYLTNGNYLDGLFVHKDFQGQGIATKLLRAMEVKIRVIGFDIVESDVSITALPFFEFHAYKVKKKQEKLYKNIVFENYLVYKSL